MVHESTRALFAILVLVIITARQRSFVAICLKTRNDRGVEGVLESLAQGVVGQRMFLLAFSLVSYVEPLSIWCSPTLGGGVL